MGDVLYWPAIDIVGTGANMSDIRAAYTDDTGTGDIHRDGYTYSDSPRINQSVIYSGADVIVARVGNSEVVLGQGGYMAPRS